MPAPVAPARRNSTPNPNPVPLEQERSVAEAHDKLTDWERIVAHLPPEWRQLADQMKLIRDYPPHMKTKVKDIGDLLRVVLHYVAGSSLRMTAALASATGILVLSSVALHQWMKKLGPYLAAVLQRMVGSAAFLPEYWGGLTPIAGDATTVQRPGSTGTTARVHYALRLADLSARHIEVTDDKGGETARRFQAEPGELWLFDRAYANPPGVAAIHGRGAHVIVRYNRGSLPLYDEHDNLLDVDALLRQTSTRGQAYHHSALVKESKKKEGITGRLCWLHLPEDKALEARQRFEREAEGECDADALYAAEFVVVFTTTTDQLSAHQVLELYRARWQVELDFKRRKSIEDLDTLPNFLPETIYSWICAKLLLQQIAHRIATSTVAFPPQLSSDAPTLSSPSPPPPPPREPRCAPAIAEPWYVTKLVWRTVCSALLPLSLEDLPKVLTGFVDHLRRAKERASRPRQLDTLRAMFGLPKIWEQGLG